MDYFEEEYYTYNPDACFSCGTPTMFGVCPECDPEEYAEAQKEHERKQSSK